MELGGRRLEAWLAGSPAHQLFTVEGGQLLYRFLPRMEPSARVAHREIMEQMAPGLPGWTVLDELDDELLVLTDDPLGTPLANLVEALRTDPRRALLLSAALLGAVGDLHQAGARHGALSATRALRGPDGRLLLLDHGVGPFAAVCGIEPSTEAFVQVWGDPGCVAPELLRREEAGPAADVFAAAALCRLLLDGSYAHGEGAAPLIAARVLRGDMLPCTPRDGGVGSELCDALDAALAPDPAKRPGITELRRMMEQAAAEAAPGLEEEPLPEPRAYSTGFLGRDPGLAPGPPGSDAERRRDQALKQVALPITLRRERSRPAGPASNVDGRRVWWLVALIVLLGLLFLIPRMLAGF